MHYLLYSTHRMELLPTYFSLTHTYIHIRSDTIVTLYYASTRREILFQFAGALTLVVARLRIILVLKNCSNLIVVMHALGKTEKVWIVSRVIEFKHNTIT